MRLNKILICALLVCALAMPAGFADDTGGDSAPATEAPKATEAPTPTEAPATPVPATEAPATQIPATETPKATDTPATGAPEATEPPAATEAPATAEPTATVQASAGPTAGPTENPDENVAVNPTETATANPSASATAVPDPTAAVDPTATVDPNATPEPSPSPTVSPSPEALPTPGAIEGLVTVLPEGSAQDMGGVWIITPAGPDSPLAFTWTTDLPAHGYVLYMRGAGGSLNLLAQTRETRIELASAGYASGQYTLYVGALLEDGSAAWGQAAFQLASGGSFPGGMGGRPSGGSGSGAGAGAGMMEEDSGFRVTPGEALSSDHAAGTRDMTAFTDANIEAGESSVTALVLGDTQAEITLDYGMSSFFVAEDAGKLILIPEAGGEAWQLSALAMESLANSGYERLVLQAGGMYFSIPCEMSFTGRVYAGLRAQGYVAKDCRISVNENGLRIAIAGTNYSINDSGELAPLEG